MPSVDVTWTDRFRRVGKISFRALQHSQQHFCSSGSRNVTIQLSHCAFLGSLWVSRSLQIHLGDFSESWIQHATVVRPLWIMSSIGMIDNILSSHSN